MDLCKFRLHVVIAILFAGSCAGAAQESVLYSFTGENGDANPAAGLIFDSRENLYGTSLGNNFNGTVFELTPEVGGSWTETALYSFPIANNDGAELPGGAIMDAKGNLYGTNAYLGQHGCGTAFELIPDSGQSWTEKILYQFGATSTDACRSKAGLIFDAMGNLYGTTYSGGDHNLGTVFKLSPRPGGGWTENVLWSFAGAPSDGSYPEAGLVLDAAGNLYGTTNVGGSDGEGGVVFELMPQAGGAWTEKILYSFCPYTTCADGFMPQAGLIFDQSGNLFGTTPYGGQYGATSGTVFELIPQSDGSWEEDIIHNFHGAAKDGTFPVAGLVFDAKGNLYGTTNFGGSHSAGTVFKLAPGGAGTWAEEVIYNFGSEFQAADGNEPLAGLVLDHDGNLYGTTSRGGSYGAGTVFAIANPNITAVPQFSLASGTYAAARTVSLTDYTSGAAIYYTTDGDDPTADSTRYKDPIRVTENETIKAIAVAEELSDSAIATASYKIAAAAPQFSLKSGTYDSVQFVTLTDAATRTGIRYTLNGDTPTESSAPYSAPIRVGKTETIKAIAFAHDHAPSAVAAASYTIHLPAAAPAFSPAPGDYASAITVHLSDATSGATIFYTTNGATPTTSSTKYTETGIKVSQSETVKAIATAPDRSNSAIVSGTYTIK
jgi:uncharacterized repeat protein (TIGR03803 family)